MNSIVKLLFRVFVERALGYFVSSSTQIITDLTSCQTTGWSTTALSNAIAAAGPILDLPGIIASVKLNAQEMAEKLAYILQGSQIQSGSPITAPTGGVVTSSSDSANYNLLTGIYQILK
jgi:hypothetical protein